MMKVKHTENVITEKIMNSSSSKVEKKKKGKSFNIDSNCNNDSRTVVASDNIPMTVEIEDPKVGYKRKQEQIPMETEDNRVKKKKIENKNRSDDEADGEVMNDDSFFMQDEIPQKKKAKKAAKMDLVNADINDEEMEEIKNDDEPEDSSAVDIGECSFVHDGQEYKFKIINDWQQNLVLAVVFEENDVVTKYNDVFIKHEMVNELDEFQKSLQEKGIHKKKKLAKCMNNKVNLLNLTFEMELLKAFQTKQTEIEESNLKIETPLMTRMLLVENLINHTSSILEKQLSPVDEDGNKGANLKEENDPNDDTDNSEEEPQLRNQSNARTKLHDSPDKNSGKISNNKKSPDARKSMERSRKSGLDGKKCYNCNAVGHISRECPNSMKSKKVCSDCGSDEHLRRDCPERKSGMDKPSPKCFNCNETGHLSRDCPSEKRCDFCGSTDHMRRDCAQRKSGLEPSSNLCYNCSEVGHSFRDCPRAKQCEYCGSENHLRRDCPEAPQSASGNTKCYNCNEFGHISRDCSKKPRRNSFPGRKCCDECGSEDHLRRDCPNRQSGSGSKCYNCNKTGHISRDCPNKARKCCSECGSEEHLRRECPERKRDSDVKCFNCNEVGHISRECPSKTTRTNSYSSVKCCNECGSEEHLMRNCPQRKNKSAANTKCFNCNKLGHISKDCPEGPKKRNRCSDCGSEGHLRRDCPEAKMGSDEESS